LLAGAGIGGGAMIVIAVFTGILSAVFGHMGALTVPVWLGFHSTTTSGMMAAAVGGFFLLAWLFSPSEGLIAKWFHRSRGLEGLEKIDIPPGRENSISD